MCHMCLRLGTGIFDCDFAVFFPTSKRSLSFSLFLAFFSFSFFPPRLRFVNRMLAPSHRLDSRLLSLLQSVEHVTSYFSVRVQLTSAYILA